MKQGDKVNWLHTPRGGYGYTQSIAAVVEGIGSKRVAISVMKNNGELVRKSVRQESLTPREKHVPGLD